MRALPAAPKAVLFDFDGTLADTEPIGLEHIRTVLNSYGIDIGWEELVGLVGNDDRLTIPPILERAGVEQTLEDYLRDLDACPSIYFDEPIEPMEGAVAVIDALRERGVRCGLVSSTPGASIVMALNRMGLVRRFDCVVCGDMAKRLKPYPDMYLRAISFLGVEPQECIVFEDSPAGIAAAQAAGAYAVGFTGGSIAQDVSAADAHAASWAEAADLLGL